MKPLIEFHQAEMVYGNIRQASEIIGPVSFTLFEGQSMGLIGESGAGKSTVGLEALGLLGFRGGQRTKGRVIRHLPLEEIAYIPQDPLSSLDPLFSIGSQLRELVPSSEKIKEVLARVSLDSASFSQGSYPHELSGGMRQRVIIAMALLRGARVIVADEPTSSLDVTLQADILELFRGLQDDGITFLFITHNLPLAAEICAALTVMRLGKVIESGKTPEVLQRPREAYTRDLLMAIPRIEL